eukprot:scaffold1997_cov318-Pavlova_lutheri.AAC.16
MALLAKSRKQWTPACVVMHHWDRAWSKSILGKSSRTPGLASSYLLRPYRWKAETRGPPRWYIPAKKLQSSFLSRARIDYEVFSLENKIEVQEKHTKENVSRAP